METWQRARERLRKVVGDGEFDAWIKPLRAAEVAGGKVLLEAPNKFCRDWIVRNYLEALRTSFRDGEGPLPEVLLRVESSRQQELFRAPEPAPVVVPAKRRANARVGNLVPHYTFNNFVVGPSNQLAHAVSLAVANRLGDLYNPLFLYGTVGVGKTHLANAIGHRVLEKNPLAKIVYLTSEAFVNDLISSLRRNRMDDFKNRFRKVDILILDDAQFLAGRQRTQEEFFHTFNSLHEKRRQIVLTSDKFPKDIPDLQERLQNRFEWGLTADIQAPDTETRAAIVQKKAELTGLSIAPEVAHFIADEIGSDVRKLEGALTRLGAVASLRGDELTLAFAREALKPHFRSRPREITIEDVQKAVCMHYGVSLDEMLSKRRTQHIAPARQVAMYLVRRLTGHSFPVIGDKFGGRHHSTVIHAQEAVGRRSTTDPRLSSTLESLEKTLTRGKE